MMNLGIPLYTSHKTMGLIVLALMLTRVLWRFTHKPPALPISSMPSWQVYAAHTAHFLLYVFAILTPLFGWIMASASPYTIKLFGIWIVPKLPIAAFGLELETIQYIAHEGHELCALLLALTMIMHIGGALYHHFINEDGIMLRMFPTSWNKWLNSLRGQ